MSVVKIIKPYLRKSREEHKNSLVGNLYAMGRTRVPGARAFITLKSDGYGRYLTGMDENAREFNNLDEKEKEDAKALAKAKRVRLEGQLGVSLASDSPYWKDVQPYILKDEDNIFDLNNPNDEVTYSWLSQITSLISPSIEEIQSGKNYTAEFYVYSPTENSEKEFNRKKRINEAIKSLDLLGETELRRVQYLLNLNLPNSTAYSNVYNEVDEYIRTPKSFTAADPVDSFMKIVSYNPETMNIKFLVKSLIDNRLIKTVGDAVAEGNNTIAKSVLDFEIMLKEPDVFFTWSKKLEEKLNITNAL